MSDYIPTTAEVRDAYSSESSDSKFANRAFDLWLARYKAKIIAQTEERIIKLLEDDLWHDIRFVTRSPDEDQAKYHDGECLGCRQIALIKGEK